MGTSKSIKEQKGGTISHFGNEKIESRMLAMGVLPGADIRIVRSAPGGGAFYLKINNQNIAVRSGEADNIFVK